MDWGRTAADYTAYRPGYPDSFYRRLGSLGIGRPGQRVVDLGTGTGHVARALARRGCRVVGVDIAEPLVESARLLARNGDLHVEFRVAPAEATGLPPAAFDVVTASQCWLYFDRAAAIDEVLRLLAPGGRLVTCHSCWLPRQDRIAGASEQVVLRHNPAWTGGDWAGVVPVQPKWSVANFDLRAMLHYDEAIPFTRESWRGRMRACRGVGASLAKDAVSAFDSDLARFLEDVAPAEFSVLHRIDAHVLTPRR